MQNGLPGADLIEAGVIDLREGRETVARSEEHTSELQSQSNLVCRLLLEKKKTKNATTRTLRHMDIVPPVAIDAMPESCDMAILPGQTLALGLPYGPAIAINPAI